jgi:hypothetical protein
MISGRITEKFTKGDIVQYICHSEEEGDYDYDINLFRLGELYEISGNTPWTYIVNDIGNIYPIGNVHEYQIEKVVYDNKLNRVLYPDYIQYEGYLIREI